MRQREPRIRPPAPPVIASLALAAWLLAAATAVFLAWIWNKGSPAGLPLHMAIAMPGILLLSLHAMSHDGALIVVTAAVGVIMWPIRSWLPWVGGIWMLGASQALIKQLGFSPGFFMLLLALLWAWLLLVGKRHRDGSVVAPGRWDRGGNPTRP